MPKLTILCGPSGAGKTTTANQLSTKPNTKVYHYDDMPAAQHPLRMKPNHEYMFKSVREDLLAGYDVVCDDIHIKKQQRLDILSSVTDLDCFKRLIVIYPSLEECLRRNNTKKYPLPEMIVETLHERYEPPSIEEGWDEITYL